MLGQFNQALSGTIGPCLLVMSLSVLLTVGEGRNRPASRRWRAIGVAIAWSSPYCAAPPSSIGGPP